MNDQVSTASLQLPDLSTINHQVAWMYKNLSVDSYFKFFMLKFFGLIFVNGYTQEQLVTMFQDKTQYYAYFAESVPTLPVDLADKYAAFYLLFMDAIKDKIESYKSQISIIKQVTTGQPYVSALDLEFHYTGWYIVIY